MQQPPSAEDRRPADDRPPADQHDTIVLGPIGPHVGSAGTHDTAVLVRPPAPPTPAVPDGPSRGGGQHRRSRPEPATGWQSVHPWPPAPRAAPPAPWTPQRYPQPLHPVPPGPQAAPILVMRNNAAVIGATLGSVALFLSLIPLIGLSSLLVAPIGLITSTVGLMVGFVRKVGRVGAAWGMLTSAAALLVCLAWAALALSL